MNDLDSFLEQAQQGISEYLNLALEQRRIDQSQFDDAYKNTFPNLKKWWTSTHIDQVSPGVKEGIRKAIENKQWETIVNAYRQSVRFGTGGIRGMMAFDRDSIVQLKEKGIHAPILKGPNTINDVVLLLTSAGVAKFGKAQKPQFNKIVIGYDSRIRGHDLAQQSHNCFSRMTIRSTFLMHRALIRKSHLRFPIAVMIQKRRVSRLT